MSKSNQIIIGAYCRSESPNFLVMTILVPPVIKTEIINSFYKYKYMKQPNKKELKGQGNIAKTVPLSKYTHLSFPLSLKF